MKISSEDWKAAWSQLLQSLCKYCTHSQRACAHTHTHNHTQTLLASVWRRDQLDQPQSLALPHRLSSFCSAAEVKHHQLVGFGGFLITSEYFVQANHYGGKYSGCSGSIRGITAWLHVMAINPQCKYCLSLSGVFNPSVPVGEYRLNPCSCIHVKHDKPDEMQKSRAFVQFTGKNCCFVKSSIWVAQISYEMQQF